MRRSRAVFTVGACLLLYGRASCEVDSAIPAPDQQEADQSKFGDETAEEKGILPASASVKISSQPVTPISEFPEKGLYDQGRDELARAEALWAAGDVESASDIALESYDDLMEIRRRKKKERKKLYAERQQSATVYVQSSIKFVQDYVAKRESRPQALEEGRGRLEDLRDVARNYQELNRALNKAIEQLQSPAKP